MALGTGMSFGTSSGTGENPPVNQSKFIGFDSDMCVGFADFETTLSYYILIMPAFTTGITRRVSKRKFVNDPPGHHFGDLQHQQ